MKKALGMALVVAWLTGAALAAPAPAPSYPDLRIPYEKHILPNGLTLLVHEDHKAPIVAVNVWYRVGSKDEPPGRQGFAHLFEHLMFNGSEHYNDEFFRPLSEAGATKVNGTTWNDRTTYFENVPINAVDRALWLESDRMGHLLGAVDQKKLDEQRGVVLNEKRQSENQPYGRMWEVVMKAIYPSDHPYSWTTIGSEKDLNAATLEDVQQWFRTHYGAANAIVVVAGDVDPAVIKKKVEHYFGNIPAGPSLQKMEAWPAPREGQKRMTMQDRVPQARLLKAWNVPGLCHADTPLLDLAASILVDGKNSRLYQRLVYRDRIATSVSGGTLPFEIASPFTLDAFVQAGGDVQVVERAMNEELERFLREGPTEAELQRVKTAYFAGKLRALEQIDGYRGKAALLAMYEAYCGAPEAFSREADLVRKATRGAVLRAAQQWLGDGVFTLEVQPFPEHKTTGEKVDRSQLPALGEAPSLRLPPLERFALSNGLTVALAEYPSPVVQFTLLVDGGFAADYGSTPGTARLMLDMLDEGTRKRDALAIAARKEALGAELGASADLDSFTLSLNALPDRLHESLELFADVVMHPTFPEAELQRVKQLSIAAVQQEKAQPSGIASRLYPRLLFGPEHPYATPTSGLGSESQLATIERQDLASFYRRWVRPDKAVLLVVGNTDAARLRPMLEETLGQWQAPSEAPPQKRLAHVPLPEQPRVFLVNRSEALQSYILAGHLAPGLRDPEDVALNLADNAFGGDFLARANLNLREDKHWSYGVRSDLVATQTQRPFVLKAPVQTDKTAESLRELLNEYQRIIGPEPLSKKEVRDAQDRAVRRLPGVNETTAEIARSYAFVLKFGLPDSYWNELVDKVEALGPEDVNAAARRLIHPQALTWVVVGDLEKIEEPIRKLGLGEVTVLDVNGNVVR